MDFRPYNARALALTQEVVDRLDPDGRDLDLPTPCPPWSVRDLLQHMLAQHLRFGAVARGEDPEAACPVDKAELGDDPAAAYRDGVRVVIESFAQGAGDDFGGDDDAGADAVAVLLPEIGRPVPLGALISFHFFDFVVHAWDLAVPIGAPYGPPAELSRLAFQVGQVIPESSRVPGAAFAPIVPIGDDATELARLLGLAGRDPGWSA